jgi:hypothetical protein
MRHPAARTGMLPSAGFKFGRRVDSVLMQNALREGDRTLPHAMGRLLRANGKSG